MVIAQNVEYVHAELFQLSLLLTRHQPELGSFLVLCERPFGPFSSTFILLKKSNTGNSPYNSSSFHRFLSLFPISFYLLPNAAFLRIHPHI